MSKEELTRSLASVIYDIKQTPEFLYREAQDFVLEKAVGILREFDKKTGLNSKRTEKIDLQIEGVAINVWLEEKEYTMSGDTDQYPALMIETNLRHDLQEVSYFFLKPTGFENLKGKKPSYAELITYTEILEALENHYAEKHAKGRK